MEEVKNEKKQEQATPDEGSKSYLPAEAIEKINLHCYVMEKCLSGACAVIERILSGNEMDKFSNVAENFNQFGSEPAEIPKPIILANAIIIGSKIYEKVSDEIEKQVKEG